MQSNTAVYHPKLNGQVPEMIMKGQTADISNLAEYEWNDWIVYWEKWLTIQSLRNAMADGKNLQLISAIP